MCDKKGRGNFHRQVCKFTYSVKGNIENDFNLMFYYNCLFQDGNLSRDEQIDLFSHSHLCDCSNLVGENAEKCKEFLVNLTGKHSPLIFKLHVPHKGFEKDCLDETLRQWCREKCCICLDDIFSMDKKAVSISRFVPCNHLLHFKCVMASFSKSLPETCRGLQKCPFCRTIIDSVCITSEGLQISRNDSVEVNYMKHINVFGRRWSL
mgnify:CR=1 FL=1